MLKKLLVLSLGFASVSNVWADDASALYSQYDALSEEGKAYVKQQMKNDGWIGVSSGGDFQSNMSYDYVKTLSSGRIEAWIKSVVVNDLTKDGLSLGDYSMELFQFDCNDRTSKQISYTDYNKKSGTVIRSYTYPTYGQFKAVIPGSVGEARLENACFIGYIKTH